MVKYICNDCLDPDPCEIIVADGSYVPSCCPFRLTWKAANWHEAAKNLQDNIQDMVTKTCQAMDKGKENVAKARESRLSEQYHNGPEKKTLPKRVEVGGYVFDPARGYGKIIGGSINACHIQFECMEASFLPEDFAGFKQARLRPYNEDEMQRLVGKVLHGNDFDFSALILYAEPDASTIETLHYSYTAEELKQDYTIDGHPAGVLEHLKNGEWVQ
jgi:hypothetical protein